MKAIITGAGRGNRLMPETDSRPKCMMDGVGGTARAGEEHRREKR